MLTILKNWFENKSLNKKILQSYIFFCIIPLIITTSICYVIFFNALYNSTKSKIVDSNNKISVLMDNKFKQYEHIVNNVIYDPQFICIFQNGADIMTEYEVNQFIEEKMSEIKSSIPELEDFTIYSDCAYENDFFKPLDSINNNYNILYSTKQNVSTWYSENGQTYGSYPIFELYNNNLLGIITIKYDMEALTDTFAQINNDEFGIYIFGPTNDKLYSHENFSFEIGKITYNMLKEAESTAYISGRNFIIGSSYITSHKIHIFCIVPENSIIKPIVNFSSIMILVWAFCLIVVICLCFLMSKSIAKRVKNLENQMTKVAKGELSDFSADNSLDEIGNMSRIFAQTLTKLNTLINDNYLSKIKLQDAKNKALIAQINPHFLYNTLNMIAGQAIITENQIISDVVMQLSDYYRTTLNKGKNLISIQEEIRNVNAYCNLQLRLHDYNFKVFYDIDQSCDSDSTINLCLQPLVENAIEHGINNMDTGGIIKISLHHDNNLIIFNIQNNGSENINCNPNDFINMTTKGYGLNNIQNRIKLIFGQQYGLSLSCNDSWFNAKIVIPKVSICDTTDYNGLNLKEVEGK